MEIHQRATVLVATSKHYSNIFTGRQQKKVENGQKVGRNAAHSFSARRLSAANKWMGRSCRVNPPLGVATRAQNKKSTKLSRTLPDPKNEKVNGPAPLSPNFNWMRTPSFGAKVKSPDSRPNACSDRIAFKKLSIEQVKSYQTVY